MVFGRNFCEKRQIWVSELHFGKVMGNVYDLSWWLVGKPMVNCLFALIELFRYLLWFWSYEAKCAQFGRFHMGSTSLHSNFTWTVESSTWTFLGTRKLETLGYPIVKTASLCIPSFWHNTGVWRTDGRSDGRTDRRTDGRICRSISCACKASFAARRKNAAFWFSVTSQHNVNWRTTHNINTVKKNDMLRLYSEGCYVSPGRVGVVDNVSVERRRMAKASRNVAQLSTDELKIIDSSGDT